MVLEGFVFHHRMNPTQQHRATLSVIAPSREEWKTTMPCDTSLWLDMIAKECPTLNVPEAALAIADVLQQQISILQNGGDIEGRAFLSYRHTGWQAVFLP